MENPQEIRVSVKDPLESKVRQIKAKSRRSSKSNVGVVGSEERPSGLRWLPGVFQYLAIMDLVTWFLIGFMAFINKEDSGYLFTYGIGSFLALLATARVIQLLQNIDDELYHKRISDSA